MASRGLKHLATTSEPPALYDPGLPDVVAEIPTERADRHARWLARSAGYLVGWSAGAAVAAAIEIVRREPAAYVVADRVRHRCALPERAAPVGGRVSLRLPGALADEIRRHGEAAYPAECCGALIGRAEDGAPIPVKEVQRLWPAVNRRTDDPHRYLIAPDDLRRLEREVRAGRAGDRRLLSLASGSPGRGRRPSTPSTRGRGTVT